MFSQKTNFSYLISFFLIVCFLIQTYILNVNYVNETLTVNNNTLFNPIVLLTSIFLHANIFHLAMNILALIQIGTILENNLSKNKFIILFYFSGLLGSLFSVLYIYIMKENIMVLGASGAIFGLYIYLSLIENKMKSFYVNVGIFHALIFSLNLPVAWYGHLGGIVGGILFYLFFNKRTNTKNFKKMVLKKQF